MEQGGFFSVEEDAPCSYVVMEDDEKLWDLNGLKETRWDKTLHNEKIWRKFRERYVSKEWMEANAGIRSSVHHQMQLVIQKQTWAALERGSYFTSDGKCVKLNMNVLKEYLRSTRVVAESPACSTWTCPPFAVDESRVFLFEGDCVDAALYLREGNVLTGPPCHRVAVLNMANPFTPGGGYRGGAGAQEENLFRRSNLLMALEQNPFHDAKTLYPIPQEGCLYSENVCFFRCSEHSGYRFMMRPHLLDVVSCAGLRHPHLTPDHLHYATQESRDLMRAKFRSCLLACRDAHVDAVVMSALGCGAFRNPPSEVASALADVLQEARAARQCPPIVAVAIYNDHNANKAHNPEGNVEPFRKALNVQNPIVLN